MKSLTVFVSAFTFLAFVSCNKKVENNEENKNVFVANCVSAAKKETAGMFKDEDINTYCDCAADKALGEFTTAEMLQLNVAGEGSDVQKRLMEVIQPCIDDLSKKVQP